MKPKELFELIRKNLHGAAMEISEMRFEILKPYEFKIYFNEILNTDERSVLHNTCIENKAQVIVLAMEDNRLVPYVTISTNYGQSIEDNRVINSPEI